MPKPFLQHIRLHILAFVFMGAFDPAQAATYTVSPGGSDSNPGTSTRSTRRLFP